MQKTMNKIRGYFVEKDDTNTMQKIYNFAN